MWKDYFPAVDAIVFLVDVADASRFSESKAELDVIFALMSIDEIMFFLCVEPSY